MNRIIVDYKKLNKELLLLVTERFEDGFDNEPKILFTNRNNEIIEAIEIKMGDTIYLVKLGVRLKNQTAELKNRIEDDLNNDYLEDLDDS